MVIKTEASIACTIWWNKLNWKLKMKQRFVVISSGMRVAKAEVRRITCLEVRHGSEEISHDDKTLHIPSV